MKIIKTQYGKRLVTTDILGVYPAKRFSPLTFEDTHYLMAEMRSGELVTICAESREFVRQALDRLEMWLRFGSDNTVFAVEDE